MAHEPRQHCIDAGLEVAKTLNLPVWRLIVARYSLSGQVFGVSAHFNPARAAVAWFFL
jgi:hypothetical protein